MPKDKASKQQQPPLKKKDSPLKNSGSRKRKRPTEFKKDIKELKAELQAFTKNTMNEHKERDVRSFSSTQPLESPISSQADKAPVKSSKKAPVKRQKTAAAPTAPSTAAMTAQKSFVKPMTPPIVKLK